MANRDPEPESDREEYSPEYLKKRRAGEPMAAAPPEPQEDEKDWATETDEAEKARRAALTQEERDAEDRAEVARRAALTQEERDAEDRAKATRSSWNMRADEPSHVPESESPAVGRILDAEEAAAKVEADRRSALTQEERDAEDRAKGV